MDTAAQQLDAKFTLALGDNFYYHGVSGDSDARFKDTFEDCFVGDHLQATAGHTFHVIAGNHDHLGDVQAQIDYSSKSDRWSFPSLYYKLSKTAPDGATLDIVMIDTVALAGNSDVLHPELGTIERTLNGDEMPGPLNVSVAQSQMQWIDETLAASTADYVIVAGHYPVYSAAEHGPTKQMSPSNFQCGGQPCLQRYKVSAYLCGHDHAEQFIDMGDGTQYHVIGAANLKGSWEHASLYTDEQLKFKALTDGGFATVSVNKKGMQIKHFDGAGTLLYTAPSISPRGSLLV
jgi:3',5'-cyclic AMP phosphodiesterase CpdA